jgi:hypothetical protein
MFRENTDEDEPDVLKNFQGTIAVQIKDSSSEVSLDKLYHEFYHNGEPTIRTEPNQVITLTPEQEYRVASSSARRHKPAFSTVKLTQSKV